MSENLKVARMLKNLNQTQVAKTLGMALSTYCDKETGKRPFTVPEAKILMELFDKKFEELF